MSPLAVPLCTTDSLRNSTICFRPPCLNCHCSCEPPKTPLGRSSLSCGHCPFLSPHVSPLPSPSLSLWVPSLPFPCPLSVVIPDDGVPGSPLYTLSPGGSPHQEVSSLLCISRFPGPAQISLLNARSVEANAHCSFHCGCRPGISGPDGSSASCSQIIVLSLRYPSLQMAPSSFFSSQAGNLNVTFTTDCPYFFMNN